MVVFSFCYFFGVLLNWQTAKWIRLMHSIITIIVLINITTSISASRHQKKWKRHRTLMKKEKATLNCWWSCFSKSKVEHDQEEACFSFSLELIRGDCPCRTKQMEWKIQNETIYQEKIHSIGKSLFNKIRTKLTAKSWRWREKRKQLPKKADCWKQKAGRMARSEGRVSERAL